MAALDEEKIKAQAKAIMDDFMKALGRIGELSGEVGLERGQGTRAAKVEKPDRGFRESILRNAPKKDDGHIVAERKSW